MIANKLFIQVKTVEEAIAAASAHSDSFKYLAGGTDLLVNTFQGNQDTNCLIDIRGIDALQKVERNSPHPPEMHAAHFLKIGSLVRLDDLKKHPLIAEHFPALLEAAHQVASPILRKTASIGGNVLCENRCVFYNQSEWWRTAVGYCLKCEGDVCIATGGTKACFSKFVSDTAPVLISMDAQIEMCDTDGTKTIPLENIYTGDGIYPRALSKTAILTQIQIPLDRKFKTIFKKLRPREAVDFTSLTTATTLDASGRLKIVLGGVDPKPVVVEGSIHDNPEELIKLALKKARLVDNDYYSRNYRKEMIRVYLQNSIQELNILTK